MAFRQKLAELTGPSKALRNGVEQPFWSRVWDAMFDRYSGEGGGLRSPEVLGQILQQALDFPRWDPDP